jgi:heterotetrameric sarcosine oxidase beta subunit
MKYSVFSLFRQSLKSSGQWPSILKEKPVKKSYQIIIVGAGGHGLATAHYLVQNHGITDILVIDSGWLGGGNTARNTTIVRSDYLLNASFELKHFALGLWQNLSREVNFNLMVSPRGYVDLAHSDGELEHFMLRANSMRLGGADVEILDNGEIKELVPSINLHDQQRFPVAGGLYQPDGGVVRHDAVAWGLARSASQAGVDIVQNCPVTKIVSDHSGILGIQTPNGIIEAEKVLVTAASGTAKLLQTTGIHLPMDLINVQAMVSEPVKPVLDQVVNYNAGLSYISQTAKGELVLGGGTDGYCSTARRGAFSSLEQALERAYQLFPFLSQLRLMRHWSGTADIPMDGNALCGNTTVKNLAVNCGWGYAGFKATPAVGWNMAELLATGSCPEMLKPFDVSRFESGALIDDAGIGPYPWLH